jgi:hypothetical protein
MSFVYLNSFSLVNAINPELNYHIPRTQTSIYIYVTIAYIPDKKNLVNPLSSDVIVDHEINTTLNINKG